MNTFLTPDLVRGKQVRFGFRPARWVVVALAISRLWRVRRIFSVWSAVWLAWGFMPRKVKLAVGGVAAATLLVMVGAVAALGLALSQLA
jgi:hypothetical protein